MIPLFFHVYTYSFSLSIFSYIFIYFVYRPVSYDLVCLSLYSAAWCIVYSLRINFSSLNIDFAKPSIADLQHGAPHTW